MEFRKEPRSIVPTLNQSAVQLWSKPVLIIEDQASLAQFLRAKLRTHWDCEVIISHDYKTTQSLIRQYGSNFQIAISDLHLPDALDGKVVDLLIESNIPTVVLSASLSEQLRETMLQKGIVDYVLKNSPNAYDYIIDLVERLALNSKTKLLLVDDSASVLAYTKCLLKPLQFQILTASNGLEALKLIEKEPDIKIVLTDYNMPVMDGFAFSLAARKLYSRENLCIVGLSSSDNKQVSANFLKHGANDYITKPFSYEELFCRIHQNLNMQAQFAKLLKLANSDFLTGLPNRRYFFESGAPLFKVAKESQQPVISAMIDIDHFKKVNDTYGHDAGDLVLKKVALLIHQHLGHGALVARLGGEEFAALFTLVSFEVVVERLEQLRQVICTTEIAFNEGVISTSISIGICQADTETLDHSLKQADEFLYQAKVQGRNRLVFV